MRCRLSKPPSGKSMPCRSHQRGSGMNRRWAARCSTMKRSGGGHDGGQRAKGRKMNHISYDRRPFLFLCRRLVRGCYGIDEAFCRFRSRSPNIARNQLILDRELPELNRTNNFLQFILFLASKAHQTRLCRSFSVPSCAVGLPSPWPHAYHGPQW